MKKVIVAFGIFLLIVYGCTKNSRGEEQPEKEKIEKKFSKDYAVTERTEYGKFSLRNLQESCFSFKEEREDIDRLRKCVIRYKTGQSRYPCVLVNIKEYTSEEYVRGAFFLEYVAKANRSDNPTLNYQDMSNDTFFSCHELLPNNCVKKWISSNKIIEMTSVETQIPNDLITDYLKKYPPEPVSAEDFDEQKVMKVVVKRKAEVLMEDETNRLYFDDEDADMYVFLAAGFQCETEKDIRCLTDLGCAGGIGECPIAKTESNRKRGKKLDEFIKQALSREINLDRVDWRRPEKVLRVDNQKSDENELARQLGVDLSFPLPDELP